MASSGPLAWFVLDAVEEIDLRAFYGAYREDGWGLSPLDTQVRAEVWTSTAGSPVAASASRAATTWVADEDGVVVPAAAIDGVLEYTGGKTLPAEASVREIWEKYRAR